MAGEIDQLINVNITANAATPQVANFGTPAIVAYHTHYTDRYRIYTSLAGMVADGFSTTEPAYYMAQAITEQNPSPPSWFVIRGTTSVAQSLQFTVTDNQNGDVVGFDLVDPSGVVHHISTTVSSQTVNQIAGVLGALTVSGLTIANPSGAIVTVTVNSSGTTWYPQNINGGTFVHTTSSASPQTDLAAVLVLNPNFYGVSGSWLSPANIEAIAAWVESNKKIHAYTTCDTDNETIGSGVMGTMKTSAYTRSYGQFTGTPIQYGATALMAQRLTADPGSDTWAYKTLAGVASDTLTPTQITNIQTNNGNIYIPVAGVNVTLNGIASSGLFMDITRGIDALSADIQTRVFNLLISNPRVPYTRKGIAMVCAEVSASLQSFVRTGFLSNDSGFEPQVIQPDLNLVNPVDQEARVLKNVNFTAVAQGAIQTVKINGTVTL